MKTKLLYIIITGLLVMAAGCGKVAVNVDENTYNEKIVVDGYIFPGEKPANIKIMRNYGLNTNIDLSQLYISTAEATITDVESGNIYPLTFDQALFSYAYNGNDFIVQYGKKYRLDVKAEINGKTIIAASTTSVPNQGFMIYDSECFLGPVNYNSAVDSGDKMNIVFQKSTGTDSYISSIIALDASVETFIENNIFGIEKTRIDEPGKVDEYKSFNALKNQSQGSLIQPDGEGKNSFDIEWFSTWFYGHYRMIVYAADKNMSDYFLTHNAVMEMDGNLIEPKFHFEGDGIGVFGSAVRDTVYFEIKP